MTKPWSIHRRAEVESQEEAIDDRTDVQKLHDACRMYLELVEFSGVWSVPPDSIDRAFTRVVELINEQFGDEVDVELLDKALAS